MQHWIWAAGQCLALPEKCNFILIIYFLCQSQKQHLDQFQLPIGYDNLYSRALDVAQLNLYISRATNIFALLIFGRCNREIIMEGRSRHFQALQYFKVPVYRENIWILSSKCSNVVLEVSNLKEQILYKDAHCFMQMKYLDLIYTQMTEAWIFATQLK